MKAITNTTHHHFEPGAWAGGGTPRVPVPKTRALDGAVVARVSLEVTGEVPPKDKAGGEKVQVVSGGRFAQPKSTTWSNPFDGVTVTV